MRPLVIIFAKAPVPGRVKTRLGIDPVRAAELHSTFVHETVTMLAEFADVADIEMSTDEPTPAWSDFPYARSLQTQGDLGERIFAAITSALIVGRPQVMILGSDSPGLPPAHIRALLASQADVALGPTEDGGFYAIACRTAVSQMFDSVRWSSATTLQDTTGALARCGLTVELGPRWFDVDTLEDLERYHGASGRSCQAACRKPHGPQ